jgi:hypothetical protein
MDKEKSKEYNVRIKSKSIKSSIREFSEVPITRVSCIDGDIGDSFTTKPGPQTSG